MGQVKIVKYGEYRKTSKTRGGGNSASKRTLMASASILLFAASAANAQGEIAADEIAKRDTIVVTAQKREQDIQDVPMSLSAIGTEEIAKRGILGFENYLASIPGVGLQSQGAGFNTIVVRGVAINPENDGLNSGPATGVYFGDTPISGLGVLGNSSDIKLIDMERVEVLRGPQGTLYGAGAMGGLVRNIPNKADPAEFSARIGFDYSTTDKAGSNNSKVEGMVNLPLVEDQLALRVVGYSIDDGGVYRNVAGLNSDARDWAAILGANAEVRDNVGATHTDGARANLLWSPVSAFSADLSLLYQNTETDGWGVETMNSDGSRPAGKFEQIKFPIRRGFAPITESLPVFDESLNDEVKLASLSLEYDAGWALFTSVTSYAEQETGWAREQTYIAEALLGAPIGFGNDINYDADSTSQEFRVTTQIAEFVDLTAGYFFEDRNTGYLSRTLYNGTVFPPVQTFFLEQALTGRKGLTHHALFGEAEFKVTDVISLLAGVRWFDQERTTIDGSSIGNSLPVTTENSVSESDAIFKAGVTFEPSEEALVYAMWSQGFRLGDFTPPVTTPSLCDLDSNGFIDAFPTVSTGARSLPSDTVDNYEIGGKLSLLDGRLNVNSAIYQVNWKNIPALITPPGCATTVPAGEARNRGAEISLAFAAGNGVSIDFSGSYLDSELTETGSSNIGIVGDRLPGSPKVNLRLGFGYDFTLFDRPTYIRGDASYVGDYIYNIADQNGAVELGDYVTLDLNAGMEIGSANISIFLQNLTNEDSLVAFSPNTFTGNRLRPRTIGIRLSYGI